MLGFRRAVAWTMLGLYGLVSSGLPLPVMSPPAGTAAARKLAAKDRSRPFPCMGDDEQSGTVGAPDLPPPRA
jgi:hypothetical protein